MNIKNATTFDYNSPQETIAAIKNNLINAIWVLAATDLDYKFGKDDDVFRRQKFYDFNRKFSDIIDKHIGLLHVEHTHDRSSFREEYESEILYTMTRQIAEGLNKSDEVSVYKTDHRYSPIVKYQLTIPFVKSERSGKL